MTPIWHNLKVSRVRSLCSRLRTSHHVIYKKSNFLTIDLEADLGIIQNHSWIMIGHLRHSRIFSFGNFKTKSTFSSSFSHQGTVSVLELRLSHIDSVDLKKDFSFKRTVKNGIWLKMAFWSKCRFLVKIVHKGKYTWIYNYVEYEYCRIGSCEFQRVRKKRSSPDPDWEPRLLLRLGAQI